MKKKWCLIAVAALSALMFMSACGNNDRNTIRVGSKDFTESLIIAEIYSLALEAAGFTVDRTGHNLAAALYITL
jgi:osmoprotectant transport system substrate-binding protein